MNAIIWNVCHSKSHSGMETLHRCCIVTGTIHCTSSSNPAFFFFFKQIADLLNWRFYENAGSSNETPPGGDKTKALRCNSSWVDAEERLLRRSVSVCRLVWPRSDTVSAGNLCADWKVVPAAAGLCDHSPSVLATLSGRWRSLPGQFEGVVALYVRVVQGRNHLAWRRMSEVFK